MSAMRLKSARKRNSVLHGLEVLRSEAPTLTVTQALLFLYVAENCDITMSELALVAGLRLPTASRAARGITAMDAPHSLPPHADLLDVRPNPDNANSRIVNLSTKGRIVAGQVKAVVRAPAPVDARRPAGHDSGPST